MSRRYQGDPNPRRIRIPKDSEDRVFDTDFLSKSAFTARQQLEMPMEFDTPSCSFWVLREKGEMESAFDVGIRVNQTRIGIAASVPARHRYLLVTYTVCCPKAANGFGG